MKTATRKKVLFVDDHPLVAQGLSLQLKNDSELLVCGSASGIHIALEKMKDAQPDILVIDLTLEDGSGLDLLNQTKTNFPNVSCIILSMHKESVFVKRCIKAGAKGYVRKDQPFDVIINAIRSVARGRMYLSEAAKELIMNQLGSSGDSLSDMIDELTDREFEIFHLIGQGLRQKTIAEKLCLSTHTINAHTQNIRSKLQLDNMEQLIDTAFEWFKDS